MPLGPPLPFGFGITMIHSTAFLMADRLGLAGDKAEIVFEWPETGNVNGSSKAACLVVRHGMLGNRCMY